MKSLLCIVLLLVLGWPARPAMAATVPAAILQQDLETAAADGGLPSMVATLFSANGILWTGAAGHADAAGTRPATGRTPYRVGSISKLATSLIAMQLVQEGLLDLDVPVQRYLPDFRPANPYRRPITMRHLLGHRSGLVREPPVGSYFDFGDVPLADVVASLNRTSLVAAPGSRRKYSNAGFAVASHIIEVVAGAPFADVAHTRLLRPLGMRSTSFRLADLPAPPAHALMAPLGGPRDPAPLLELALAGAGTLNASATDLARLGQALLRADRGLADGPLTPAIVRAMVDVPENERAGLGIFVDRFDGARRIGHGGAIHGYTAELALLPDAEIGVVVLASVDGSQAAFRLADQMLRQARAMLSGRALPPPLSRAGPVPDHVAAALAGHYAGPDGSLIIRRIGGRLWAEAPRVAAEIRWRDDAPVLDHDIGWEGVHAIDLDGPSITLDDRTYQRTARPVPAEAPPALAALVGYYRRGINELILYERDGGLHVNIEWSSYEPLAIAGSDRFAFPPDSSLYPLEELQAVRGDDGSVVAVDLGGIRFERAAGVAAEDARRRAETAPQIAAARAAALASTPPSQPPGLLDPDLVDLRVHAPDLLFDIKYAGDDNFLGGPVYRTPFAYLQRPAADALARADASLRPDGLRIIVHDGYRPWYVTRIFWDLTPPEERMFVADPAEGSRHNRAAAIDISLADAATGQPVPVNGNFDEATPRSFALHVGGTDLQRWRRDRLIAAMDAAGFDVYPLEWWHFDYRGWERWPILNIAVDDPS